ncbi:hypothetical protein H0H81_011883 [Sphagnurus paluster]|uniref:Uncharacterized protein n=1 Tax=Sphagnurus paluster TaxID=117069 RepID=A0A9P7FQR4_9AGAR|nr:hypothetical protein H0H81_011883 [Sphagnurus paluster]
MLDFGMRYTRGGEGRSPLLAPTIHSKLMRTCGPFSPSSTTSKAGSSCNSHPRAQKPSASPTLRFRPRSPIPIYLSAHAGLHQTRPDARFDRDMLSVFAPLISGSSPSPGPERTTPTTTIPLTPTPAAAAAGEAGIGGMVVWYGHGYWERGEDAGARA